MRVEAGVIAEWSFTPTLAGLDISLENDLRAGGHLEINGHALDEVDALAAQKSREQQFVESFRHRRSRRERQRRIRAKRDRNLEPLAHLLGETVVLRAPLVPLPVHAGRPVVVDLHAVRADVAHAGLGVFRENHRQGDVRTAVVRPAGQNRDLVERAALS